MEGMAAVGVCGRGSKQEGERYYSAEFSLEGLDLSYQFKIWEMDSTPMCVLVKEGSEILSRLKVGEILNVKYYRAGLVSTEYLETAIRHITKDERGPFRGHYLVGLEILQSRQDKIH